LASRCAPRLVLADRGGEEHAMPKKKGGGAKAGPPDFSGQWKCTKLDGDMATLMYDLGIGLAKRTMAKGMSYGVGSQTQTIELKGDVMHIHTLPMDTKSEHQLNGKEYEAEVMGVPSKNKCTYTADCITLMSTSGQLTTVSKRYMEGGCMTVEIYLESKPANVTKRYFTKEGGAPEPEPEAKPEPVPAPAAPVAAPNAEPPKAEPPKAEPPKAEPPKAEPPKAVPKAEPKAELKAEPKAEPNGEATGLLAKSVLSAEDAKALSRATALRDAAEKGSVEEMKALMDDGVDVDARDQYGGSGLMWASLLGKVEAMQLLLERGAEVNASDKFGRTVLMFAAGNGQLAAIQLLLDKGVDIDATLKGEKTALAWAKQNNINGSHDASVALLEQVLAQKKPAEGAP